MAPCSTSRPPRAALAHDPARVHAWLAGLVSLGLVACQVATNRDPNADPRGRTREEYVIATPDAAVFDNLADDAAITEVTPDAFLPPEVCADVEAVPERVRPALSLVVDGSGSMGCAYPEPDDCDCDAQLRDTCQAAPGASSRWQALQEALFAGDGLIARLHEVVDFGLLVYHDPLNAPSCPTFPVDLPALATPSPVALQEAFPAQPPGANTPTALALSHALSNLPEATAERPQHVLLATDGKPHTCFDSVTLEPPEVDYARVVAQAEAAHARAITLHVLSLAPAALDFAAHLSSVAAAGGSGDAHVPANRQALVEALQAVIASAISCTVSLNGAVDSDLRCSGTVALSGRALACEQERDGYRMLDESRLELLGDACDTFKRDPQASLSVSFPCKAFQAR